MVNGHGLAEGRPQGAHSPGSLPGMLWEGLIHWQQQHIPTRDLWLPASATLLHAVPVQDGHEKGLSPRRDRRWGLREPGKSKVAVEESLG